MLKKLTKFFVFFLVLFTLVGCNNAKPNVEKPSETPQTEEKPAPVLKSFDFIIYERDADNSNLSDNKVVVKYTVTYDEKCVFVTDALIKVEDISKDEFKYTFTEGSNDYLILKDSQYGLSYTKGYFANYGPCANNTAIDVSWSMTTVNGTMASAGIGQTKLEGLTEYGFVIDGFKQ